MENYSGDVYEPDEEMLITLEMEDGTEEECIVLDIFEVNGRDYIALLPSAEAEKEDANVYFYGYSEDEQGEPILRDIEDDDEYEAVCDRFDEILDEEEFEDEYGEDGDSLRR